MPSSTTPTCPTVKPYHQLPPTQSALEANNLPQLRRIIRYGFYPTALVLTLLYLTAEVGGRFGPVGSGLPIYLLIILSTMTVLERLIPLRKDWGMTRESFLVRDLPMIIVNGSSVALTTLAVTTLAAYSNTQSFSVAPMPWWLQALLALLFSDLLWYSLHRYSHQSQSRLGRWLWKTHALHHLPNEVYVLMHPAGHPINAAYVRVLLLLPSILFGMSPEAIFAASLINAFQGLMSHFNVDSRVGWLNHIMVGTELHRFHHSSEHRDAGNYAATFSLWDRIFGTWKLPAAAPRSLGVIDRENYPENRAWLKLLWLPFS